MKFMVAFLSLRLCFVCSHFIVVLSIDKVCFYKLDWIVIYFVHVYKT